MNKKGQDFLNVMELIIFAACMFFAILFLGMGRTSFLDEANQNVEEYQFSHKTLQALRTLAQTPVKYEDDTITYAELANIHMEAVNYYSLFGRTLSLAQRNEVQERISSSSQLLQATAQSTILPLFSAREDHLARLSLSWILLKNEQESLDLGSFRSQFTKEHEQVRPVQLQLPAYFSHSTHAPGSYYLILSISEERKFNGRLQ